MNEAEIITEKANMLAKAGLNWNVNSEPLQTVSGILIPDRIALVREDTQKVLGIQYCNVIGLNHYVLLHLKLIHQEQILYLKDWPFQKQNS